MFKYFRRSRVAQAVSGLIKTFSNKTSLLLQGNGANGGQNNTILDSSPNNLAITRFGDVTQGSASPFSPAGWSAYFNGATGSINIPSSTELGFLGGDYTIDLWIYPTRTNVYQRVALGSANQCNFDISAAGLLTYFDGTAYSIGTVVANTWYHIAASRTGSVLKLFLNGVLVYTGANTVNITTQAMYIGGTGAGANSFNGYISNFRMVKWTGLYASTFTPPLEPATAVTNTIVLCLQDNRFKDNSVNSFAFTLVGTPKVVAVSPFVPVTYSSTIHGGSLAFDGASDYLSIPSFPNLAAQNFTVETWIYITNFTARSNICYLNANVGGYAALSMYVVSSTGKLGYSVSLNGTSWAIDATAGVGNALPLGTWIHVAAVRVDTMISFYINGVYLNGVNLVTPGISLMTNGAINQIGCYNTNYFWMNGSIADFRVVTSSIYTVAFTPPVAPLTAVVNTQLLLSGTNAQIIDQAAKNAVETIGNASVSTAVKKYNSGSLAFDGTGDGLVLLPSQNLVFGTGDFTIEAQLYPVATTAMSFIDIYDNNSASRILLQMETNGTITLRGASAAIRMTSAAALKINAWNHFAMVRVAGVTKMFINGVQDSVTLADITNYTFASTITSIGVLANNLTQSPWNGYMDDYRVSKYAVYNANFVPPILESSVKTDVNDPYFNLVALELQGNITGYSTGSASITDTSLSTAVITKFGTVAKSNAQLKNNQKSIYFNSTTDYLTLPASGNWAMGDTCTMEVWLYVTVGGRANQRIFSVTNGTNTAIDVYLSGVNQLYVTNRILPVVPLNQWFHLAVVVNAGILSVFYNGVSQTTSGAAFNYTNGSSLFIGDFNGGATTWCFAGYMDSIRFTKGIARYSSNFTPSTTSLPVGIANDPYFNNVVLLIDCAATQVNYDNNTFVDASTNKLAITRVGDTTQGSFSPFSNQDWSGDFNGTTDWLLSPANTAFDIMAGDFTVEAFINMGAYNTMGSSGMTLITNYTGAGGWNIGFNGIGTMTGIVLNTFVSGAVQTPVTTPLINASNFLLNVWNHVAVTKVGSNIYFYLNGINYGGALAVGNLGGTGNNLAIGSYVQNANYRGNPVWTISNLHVVKGTAVYTGNFTPSTTPLTAIAGTTLLCLQDNRFKDNSINNFALTVTGTPKVINKSPFQVTTAYSPSVHGGSMYFDGVGDSLVTPILNNFDISSSNFTIEAWVYPTIAANYVTIIMANLTNIDGHGLSAGATANWCYYINGNVQISGPVMVLNVWTHVSAVRNAGITTLYINGISVGTTTTAANVKNYPVTIGGKYNSMEYITGYISDARIIKGTALYTSVFTPPTAPITTVTNTQLLLSGTNAALYDASGHLPVETMGTAKLSTTQFKTGNASMYFDGTAGCYAKLPAGSLNFGTSDFTIDFWYYKTVNGGANSRVFQTVDGDVICGISLVESGGGALVLYMASTASTWDLVGATTTPTLSLNTWHHIVIRRVATIFSIYIDGVLSNTFTSALTVYYTAAATPVIAGQAAGRNTACYVDDFRITIGKGKYTVEPTSALTL